MSIAISRSPWVVNDSYRAGPSVRSQTKTLDTRCYGGESRAHFEGTQFSSASKAWLAGVGSGRRSEGSGGGLELAHQADDDPLDFDVLCRGANGLHLRVSGL